MNELIIKIEAPGLTAALEQLAEAIRSGGSPREVVGKPAVPVSTPELVTSAVPANASAPVPSAAPVAMSQTAPAPVAPIAPTSPAPGYTLEQLSRAGAELITADPANLAGLQGLLQQFGVQAITMVPMEQYGAFATALRGLGAKL